MSKIDTLVLPGELLILKTNDEDVTDAKVTLGPGILQVSNDITVTKPGILRHKNPNIYWIDSHQKRYIPVKGDHVIGIVTAKAGDMFRVDIGSSDTASLSYLAFEGTTKRNRPDVKVNDILYAQLKTANKHMESELVCVNAHSKSGGMGVIRRGGFMFHCSLNLVAKILSKDSILLKSIGQHTAFESTIGANGRIWINARSTRETVAICSAISAAEFMRTEQIRAMCKQLSNVLAGFG